MPDLIVGGYAEPGARGLYALAADDDGLMVGSVLAPVVNVSGGVRLPGTARWFFVDERASRIVLLDSAAGWRELTSVPSGGDGPCHLAYDAATDVLVCANYDSGEVTLFPLDCGFPINPPATYQSKGTGPNRGRQAGPHAHWVGFAPDGRLYAVDLGSDRVLCFGKTTGRSLAEPITAYAAPPGSGPRQLALHPTLPVALLVSELASTFTVLNVAPDGSLSARTILSTLPDTAAADSLAGAIAFNTDGSRAYVSNRGDDSIASFAIDADGNTTLLGHAPSGGKSPRFLLVADERLYVAHETSGGVTALPLDGDGCARAFVAHVDIPGAAFLGNLTG